MTTPRVSCFSILLALVVLGPLPSTAQDDGAGCPSAFASAPGTGAILAIDAFDQVWCWAAAPGNPVYHVETQSPRKPWIEEAVVTDTKVTFRRGIGDSTRVRVTACWGSTCSEPSQSSRRVVVMPNFDMDGDGFVSGTDYMILRTSLIDHFLLFRAAFGRVIVDGRYEKPQPPTPFE